MTDTSPATVELNDLNRAASSELNAMRSCVAALDPIALGRGNLGSSSTPPSPSIARILRYLADRYGIAPTLVGLP